jgi:hypothetical protein
MWRIWWTSNNASKWQMGFNSAFKGLMLSSVLHASVWSTCPQSVSCVTRIVNIFHYVSTATVVTRTRLKVALYLHCLSFFMFCWPCILVWSLYITNLTHSSLPCMFISILYMFRAAMCPSSGELLYQYDTWFMSPCVDDRVVLTPGLCHPV